MRRNILIIGIIIAAVELGTGYAQPVETSLTLEQIMRNADSVSALQKTLLEKTKFRVKQTAIFNELDSKNNIKNADTVIAMVVMQGKEEISREIIYSSKPAEEKKDKEEKMELSLPFNNPNYNFSLTDVTDSVYIITVSPKAKPQKGEVSGTIKIDRRTFATSACDLKIPKPDGALKEFATSMSFEPLEGGLVAIKEMRMKGFVKALLGIFKMHFSGEIKYSDYEILE